MSYFRVPANIFSKVCFNSFTMRYCTPLSSAEGARHVLGRAVCMIQKVTTFSRNFGVLRVHPEQYSIQSRVPLIGTRVPWAQATAAGGLRRRACARRGGQQSGRVVGEARLRRCGSARRVEGGVVGGHAGILARGGERSRAIHFVCCEI